MTVYQLSQMIGSFIAPIFLIGAVIYLMRGRDLAFADTIRHPLVIALILLTIAANAFPAPKPAPLQSTPPAASTPPASP